MRVGIKSEHVSFLKSFASRLIEIFPTDLKNIENSEIQHFFTVFRSGEKVGFIKNDEEPSEPASESNVFKFLLSLIRLTVAEHAAAKVFVHAGVVVWKGKALVFPGNSFSGKTSLVRELISHGAEYYSDEYAIFDKDGLVHPFPKTLSIRGIIDDFEQVEHSAEELGARIGTMPRPVGLVHFTEFEKNAVWNPKPLSIGEGVLKIISFTIPIRVSPAFSLNVLNRSMNGALISESKRGDARQVSKEIIGFLDKNG
ncbi:MAG: hypothetical protein OEM82_13130 [Acidobacteriota bacterium]|nr:hypothetical protein [Acidobacteriota bacterium]MDH3530601.1 hypothetical protein [Acidobacteriota bacterium]